MTPARPKTPGPDGPVARALLVAALLFVASPAAAGPGNDEAGGAFLAGVARKYAAASSLRARFRQEIPLQNIGIVRKASGEVRFARPLRMRWDYDGPDAQLFLADGEHFYFRPAGSPKVYRKALDDKSLGGKIPLLLLFGKEDIAALFRVEEMFDGKEGADTVLRLVPRGDGAPEVRRVDMVVATKTLLIREIHIYDKLGGANHLYLEGTELDAPTPPGLFRFRKPAGTEVVDG